MASSAACVTAVALLTTPVRGEDTPADFTARGEVASGTVVGQQSGGAALPVARRYQGQRNFGLVATGGGQGLGLGLRGGSLHFGLEATMAWEPLLETYAEKPGDVSFKFFSTWQANAVGYWSFYRSTERSEMGLAALYQYNSVLHHGTGLAFYLQYDLAERWALHLTGGLVVFPRAEALLRDTGRFPPNGSISSGISSVRPELAVSIGFFP